jgi:predicted Ser/Thr protein kinase
MATEAGAPPGSVPFEPPAIEELAALFPQLEILECLGRGGMGAVYKARQPRLERFVALKILAPEKQKDPQFAERFEREARVLGRLSHPNIVAVYDFGEVRGRFYLLMEYVDGLTLRQVMQAGKIAPAEALELVPKICDALQYAHSQGIVHRDIKPENILLDKQGRLKIADFGIAKIAGVDAAGLTLTGARDIMGTPVYMAPEQVEKPLTVDHRADIYSLGVVFYEMLTGELPLGKFAPPSKRVQMDVRLDEVVLHALEKEPARRYQEASQVKTAVETIAGTPASFAPPAAGAAGIAAGNTALITVPAVVLIVVGALKVLSSLLGLLVFFGFVGGLGVLPFIMSGPFSVVAIVVLVHGCLITFGGYQMLQRRSYAWAVAGGVLAILSCSLLELPVGIWVLVVLARGDVKAAFGIGLPAAAAAPAQPGRFWPRFAMVAACLILLVPVTVVGLALWLFLAHSDVSRSPASVADWSTVGIRHESGEFRKDFSAACPLNATGDFSIDNLNGRTEILGWSSNLVEVAALIHGGSGQSVNDVRITVDSNPTQVRVHTETPEPLRRIQWVWSWFEKKATVDYTVRVPELARLNEVSSANGKIRIDGVTGDIKASTVNGELGIGNAGGNLVLNTANGLIKADMGKLAAGQSVSLEAINGTVRLTLPADADATIAADTVNGKITSDFSSLRPEKISPVGNQLNAILGHGSAAVKAHAVNGVIEFRRQSVPLEVEAAGVMSPATNSP